MHLVMLSKGQDMKLVYYEEHSSVTLKEYLVVTYCSDKVATSFEI